jgi:hypothetical protein
VRADHYLLPMFGIDSARVARISWLRRLPRTGAGWCDAIWFPPAALGPGFSRSWGGGLQGAAFVSFFVLPLIDAAGTFFGHLPARSYIISVQPIL